MNFKYLIFCIFLFFASVSFSQVKFKEGYIVNNNHERIDCLIRNVGVEESTSNYQYKLKDDNEIKSIELSKIEEFGINNELKCIRALIHIDAGPSRIKSLNDTIFQWEEGHAYIATLVESDLTALYSYFDQGNLLFFYRINNSAIEPLIFKKYSLEVTPYVVEKTLYNNTYLDQLNQNLVCGSRTDRVNIPYSKRALVKYFINFNACKGADYTVFREAQIKKGSFRFKLGINSNIMQYAIEEYSDALPNALFSKKNSIGYGAEFEYLFPFNKYKWGLFAETNFYLYYSDYVESTSHPTEHDGYVIDYKTVEFPVGITYYLNITEDHRLFVRAAFVPHLILKNSYIAFSNVYHSDFSSATRLFIGAGYNYKRVGAEFRYYSNQNITMNIYKRNSELSQVSMRVFYTLFKTAK